MFEKLYYDPSHYAGYSAVDNLTHAVKLNFSREEVMRWNCKTRTRYTDHCVENFHDCITTIALQRLHNKH